jgi:hypothetical protein
VRYNLGTLPQGGDLQIDSTGDLKMTRDGDLQLGDDIHNALHRLVVRWQFNVRALKTLFDFVNESPVKKAQYEDELEKIALDLRTDPAALDRWHEIHLEMGIEEYAPEAYAGTVMVVMGQILRREWADLGSPPSMWDTAGSLIAGHSFGAILEASGNNFRHSDEWKVTSTPDGRQLKSIRVIADVLGIPVSPTGANHPVRENLCPETLLVLSNGDFEILMDRFFGYARSLAGL